MLEPVSIVVGSAMVLKYAYNRLTAPTPTPAPPIKDPPKEQKPPKENSVPVAKKKEPDKRVDELLQKISELKRLEYSYG